MAKPLTETEGIEPPSHFQANGFQDRFLDQPDCFQTEVAGFEPAGDFSLTCFPGRPLKPLGHTSKWDLRDSNLCIRHVTAAL